MYEYKLTLANDDIKDAILTKHPILCYYFY